MSNITSETLEFLWYSYFGVSVETAQKTDKDEIMKICAEKAYLDMNRTLSFESDERNDFRPDICGLIIEEIKNSIFTTAENDFDDVHNAVCNKIIKVANEKSVLKNDLEYGQAQKWLNMTLKYMWLMGLWEEELSALKDVLHVPVDSYIIEAVWENEKVSLPLNKGKRNSAYSYDKVKPWSKWEEDEYKEFQKSLRENLNNKSPIEWEGPVWIKIAEKK